MQILPPGDFVHTAIEAFFTSGIAVYIWNNKRQAKAANEQRHAENKAKLDELLTERSYLRPHDHGEKEGSLQAEGIIRKPTNGR